MADSRAASGISILIEDPGVRATLDELSRLVRDAGGRARLVGGCVRDSALGRPAKDLDLEVFGIEPDRLIDRLSGRFDLDLVGRSFGVIKLRGTPIDVSIPRRESKSGRGHKGFEVDSDPQMDPSEAASRRDFTINAISVDPLSGEVTDPYGGLEDLRAGILRHTTKRFCEDPLRVLRGMQFAARFDFEVSRDTVALCRTIEPEGLAQERIFEEWKKLIVWGSKPSRGLAFLRDCGWVRYFPELNRLIDCEQDPEWHPEGDVWIHTLHCMDAFAAERVGDEREDLIVGLAVLCHDLGKPETTRRESGRVTSKGHEPLGERLARVFLARMTNEESLVDEVLPLVGAHLSPVQLFESEAGDAAIRRLARRVGRIDRLVRVATADQKGRPPLVVERFEAGEWLLHRARELEVEASAPKPIVMGRHLIELGLQPGQSFGSILEACFAGQLDGQFRTLAEGLEFAKRVIASHGL